MRMLIPIMIIVLGMLSGALICRLFKSTETGVGIGMLAGGVGAFVGLMIRDVLDISAGGDIGGSLVAAILGAVALSIMTNLVYLLLRRH